MASASIKVKVKRGKVKQVQKLVDKSAAKGMDNVVKDLARVSSEAAPYEEGDLERASETAVFSTKDEVIGVVGYEVFNKSFEYAEWIHEDTDYNLQKGSLAKADAKGLSGKSYPVDRKYLSRPLYGEAETYTNLIADEVAKALK